MQSWALRGETEGVYKRWFLSSQNGEWISLQRLCVGEYVEENSSCLKSEKYLWAPIRNYCHLLRIKALDWIAWMCNGINQLGFVIFASIHPDYYSVNHRRIFSEKQKMH